MRQEFDAAVESILAIRNSDGYSFLSFVKRTLFQFRLQAMHDVLDIVVEAYLRGVRLIESGTDIKNPTAWLRRTVYNIIREYSRAERRDRRDIALIESKAMAQRLRGDEDEQLDKKLDEQLKAVWNAFHKISSEDQDILVKRYFDRKSWQEIHQELQTTCDEQVDIGTLRVRGSRAMKRLRGKYHDEIDSASPWGITLMMLQLLVNLWCPLSS